MSEGYTHEEVLTNYAKADLGGWKAYNEGKFDTVGTLVPNFEQNFAISFYFNESSEETIRSIAQHVVDIVEKYGGEAEPIGTEKFPIHMTIANGRFWTDDKEEQQRQHQAMYEEAFKASDAEKLEGTTLEAGYLLMRPDSVILTIPEIPPAIKRMREEVVKSAAAHGISDPMDPKKPLGPRPGFLHLTLVRFRKLPENPEARAAMKKDLVSLRHELSSPISKILRQKDQKGGATPLELTINAMDHKNPLAPGYHRPPPGDYTIPRHKSI